MRGLPNELLYRQEHMKAGIEDSVATIGITTYAQEESGKLYSVERPHIDTFIEQDELFGTPKSSRVTLACQ